MNEKDNMQMRNTMKEMIRLKIKPNFAALGREYGCDYRTAKIKYYEELNKEKGIEPKIKIRKHIIDEYKDIIINKLETIPGITAYSIYYFLKVEKNYKGSYESIKNFVRENKDKRKRPASIRVEPIIGKVAQVDWKEDFKLTNKNGELFTINLFLMRLHYSKKFYARLTIDKKRDEVKTCIIESLEYFGGTPREIWFDNMATVMVKEGKHKKVHNEIKQLGSDIGFQPILCQSERPKTKGTVENLAKLCDRLLSYNNEFDTLEDLIKIVNKFNEECGNEKSQAHNKIVNEVFKDEKKYLIPLPNKNILEKYKQTIEYRKVSQDSMIVYRGNRYSVPTRFIGSYLGIRIIDNQVNIYDNTELIRCHMISNNNLNYNSEDKIEILKSDLLYGLSEEEIKNKIENTDLQIYDFLKGMN
jgi:transposase